MLDLVKFLQRILNPAAVERLAEKLNIKIPIGQMLGMMLAQLIPVVGAPMIKTIKDKYDWFIHTPPDQVAASFSNIGPEGYDLTEEICFNMFGQKICFKPAENTTLKIILSIGLAAGIGYLFLKQK